MVGAEWSLLLKAESSLVSLYAVEALSYLVFCLSPLFKERRDGYSQEGRSMQLGGIVLSAAGEKGMFQVLKALHCYLTFCSVKVLPFPLSTEKCSASGKFRLFFKSSSLSCLLPIALSCF